MKNILKNYIYVHDTYNENYAFNFQLHVQSVIKNKRQIHVMGLVNNKPVTIIHSIKLYKLFSTCTTLTLCGRIDQYGTCFMPHIGYREPGIHATYTRTELATIKKYILQYDNLSNILETLIYGKTVKNIQIAVYKLLAYEIAVKRHLLSITTAKTPKMGQEIIPLQLTPSQQEVWKEIKGDLQSEHRTSRLVYGDVGSGKTVIAYLAASLTLNSNQNVAILVPNLSLVTQTINRFKEWGINAIAVTGAVRKVTFTTPSVLIGTHALLNRNIDCGLVIIDEQHKFGVEQRSKLVNSYTDLIMLTATPIPRTLQMALTGALNYSILTRPRNVNKVEVVSIEQLENMKQRALKMAQTTKVIWIETSIENTENRFDTHDNIVIVHSGIKNRAEIIHEFIQREHGLIVGTTVLEVGLDSDINHIFIVEAHKLGISQLHQLSGRVGRRNISGTVTLIGNEYALIPFANCRDGFDISKLDLKRRGGGSMLNVTQSGLSEFIFNYILTPKLTWEKSDDINPIIIKAANNVKLNEYIIQFITSLQIVQV